MIACLPMYARPENRAAHDALWANVRAALGYGPETLSHDLAPMDSWAAPDLLLGQICNLPYRARFRDRLTRIACADYGLPDTPPGYYHSVFLTRKEDAPRGLAPATLGRFAHNEALSHSGWGAPLAHVAARGLRFHTTVQTGAHIESARAVAEGRADLAALDAITWSMLERWETWAGELAVVERTGLSPGMTFVTSGDNDPGPILAALRAGLAALDPDHQAILGIRGFHILPDRAYDIPLPPKP